jgi:hypothetical protein
MPVIQRAYRDALGTCDPQQFDESLVCRCTRHTRSARDVQHIEGSEPLSAEAFRP